MPQATNLSLIRDETNTTETFELLTPSSGDRVPAQWRCMIAPATYAGVNQRATIDVVSRWNNKRNARYIDWKVKVPVVTLNSTLSQATTVATALATISVMLPVNVDPSQVARLAHYIQSLFDRGLNPSVHQVNTDGYAPT